MKTVQPYSSYGFNGKLIFRLEPSDMKTDQLTSPEILASKIVQIRGKRVMLDEDLASLYQVATKRLNEQVRRNPMRFPEDFMFQLTPNEWSDLRSHFASSSWGGRRNSPFAFTEHGILMLSSVLNGKRAIQVNIEIMRLFVKMRSVVLTQKNFLLKLQKLEKRVNRSDHNVELIFKYMKSMFTPQPSTTRKIGFKRRSEDD